jgi:hypothetical protein
MQVAQLVAPVAAWKLPAAQLAQLEAAAAEYLPATQLAQLVAPVAAWKVPAAQLAQLVAPELAE